MQVTPQLNAAKFEDLIRRRGRDVSWLEATTCTCWNLDSGQPTYGCPACAGRGYVYQPPIIGRVLLTSITLNKEWEDMAGLFQVGDAIMTVPKRALSIGPKGIPTGESEDVPLYDVGQNDKIILLDDEFKSSEVLVKGTPMYTRPADTLLNTEVTRIKSVATFSSIDGAATYYKLGVDFRINKGTIQWIEGGNAPKLGEQYTVTYFHRPVYLVSATLPKPRHQDGQDLPRYVALKYLSGAIEQR